MTGPETVRTEEQYTAHGVWVLRRGTFIGVGHLLVESTKARTGSNPAARHTVTFDGCMRFEPGTRLVTGTIARPDGLTLPVQGRELPTPRPNTLNSPFPSKATMCTSR